MWVYFLSRLNTRICCVVFSLSAKLYHYNFLHSLHLYQQLRQLSSFSEKPITGSSPITSGCTLLLTRYILERGVLVSLKNGRWIGKTGTVSLLFLIFKTSLQTTTSSWQVRTMDVGFFVFEGDKATPSTLVYNHSEEGMFLSVSHFSYSEVFYESGS